MVLVAAVLFGINGTVSKVVLGSGITSLELTQVRSIGAALGFVLVAGPGDPASGAAGESPRLAFLALFGIAGVAFVQWF